MDPSGIPTVVVVVGDGTVETIYYSDRSIRLIVAEPDVASDDLTEAVSEPIVFDLADARFPSSVSGQVKALLNQASAAVV